MPRFFALLATSETAEKDPLQKAYDFISQYFDLLVEYLILLVEFIGIVILVYSIISAVIGLFRKQKHVRLHLAEGIALSLEFKMGGELLRTVIVRDWNELLILGAVILLRAALTFLIQWEIKLERKSGNMTALELHEIKTPLKKNPPNARMTRKALVPISKSNKTCSPFATNGNKVLIVRKYNRQLKPRS